MKQKYHNKLSSSNLVLTTSKSMVNREEPVASENISVLNSSPRIPETDELNKQLSNLISVLDYKNQEIKNINSLINNIYVENKEIKSFLLGINGNLSSINKQCIEINQLKKQLTDLKISLSNKVKEVENLKTQISLEKEKVKKTISFQLGYLLIHSVKSPQAFFSLPKDLYNLYQYSKKNKSHSERKSVSKICKPFPKINGKFKKEYGFKFISILDEISHISFDSEFNLFPLNKSSFATQIQGSTSLGLLLESCWKGNFGAWEYAFTSPNLQHNNAQNLLKAIDIAKNRNFPVIFWNKEDPMHYEKFLPISSKCDIIFTTDSNKVESYKRDVPNAKIEVMLFAANINICNPANRVRIKQENICFAGSYYGEGHDDRKKQMDALLPTIIKFKGAIYDRMSQLNNDRYAYPRKYKKFIRPSVPFREIVDIYKSFKVFLNVNTITDSPTMMSRRVYELLACGTPVISTPSLAIEKQFRGIVQIAKNAKEANKIAKRLLENEWEWRRLSHLGYREVMLNHTYEHRAIQIANVLGKNIHKKDSLVSIIMASNRPKFIDRIVTNLSKQTYKRIEVIIIAQKYSEDELKTLQERLIASGKNFENIHVIRNDSEDTLGKRLNQAIEVSKGEYVAKFDDDDFYLPNYLQDMLIPFTFGDYGIVGKKEIFVYLEGKDQTYLRYKNQYHMQTNFLTGATLVFSRKVLSSLKFGDLNKGEDSNILEQATKLGIKMYVTDPFNFIVYRAKNLQNHTWQVEDSFFTEKGEYIGKGLPLDIVEI